MTYGPYDLRLAEALVERRLLEARKSRVAPLERRPSARGAPTGSSGKHRRVGFAQPATGTAGQN